MVEPVLPAGHRRLDRGWLVPFHYYALVDPTDYKQVRWTTTRCDEADLERALSKDSERTAREFASRGVPAAKLTGDTPRNSRIENRHHRAHLSAYLPLQQR